MAELRSGEEMFTSESIMQRTPRWYAVYTAPRHEKTVFKHLDVRGVESFLPMYASERMWNGRRAIVQMPLFTSYLFVHMLAEQRMKVLEVPGVLNIVSSHGSLIPLPEGEIETLRVVLETRRSEPHPTLMAGKKVRIKVGPLQGLEGVVLRQTRQLRMVVSIDSIMRSFAVELQASDLELCSPKALSQTA
jgi:transcription antitermination factor NusG